MRWTERCPGAGRDRGSAPWHPPGFRRASGCVGSLLWLTLAFGCASSPPPEIVEWEFFAPASPERDAWYPKVAEWQTRARVDRAAPLPRPPEETGQFRFEAHPSEGGLDPLPEKLGAFALAQRRLLAERISHWTRRTAAFYYLSDRPDSSDSEKPVNGEYVPEDPGQDYWPTYSELAERNGDDCDGLDLVAYRMLQEFGFPEDELFRGIIRRDRDAANHMVTYWFEDPSDPWVFDATGAATKELRRFSEIFGWTPTTIFNESDQYAVRRGHTQLGRAAQARDAALD